MDMMESVLPLTDVEIVRFLSHSRTFSAVGNVALAVAVGAEPVEVAVGLKVSQL
jgi:hypothetical protein